MFHKYGVGENEKSKLDKMMLAVKKRGNRIVGSIKF